MKKWKLSDCGYGWGKEIWGKGIYSGKVYGSDSLHYALDSGVDLVIEPEVLSHIDSQKFSALKTKCDTLTNNLSLRIEALNEKEDAFEEKWTNHPRLLVRDKHVFDRKFYPKNKQQNYDDDGQEYNYDDDRQEYNDEQQKYADEWEKIGDDEKLTQIKRELTAMHKAVISFSDCCINISDNLWLYDGWVFKTTRKYEQEETQLLILEEIDKERGKFERLKAKFSGTRPDKLEGKRRERIPTKVRIEVWRRDDGQCASCGSRERLEYDHIIPVSKGGSSTARNIELLCEKCNREKSNKIE